MTDQTLGLVLAFGIVVAVGVFAVLPKPPWLDRIWLWAIGLSFVVAVPVWLLVQIQDRGWQAFATWAIGVFVLGVISGWPPADSRRS